MLDVSVNIIWLSDIHFNSSYKDDVEFKNLNDYIVSFHQYIDALEDKENYDYILISGDIAQGGEVEEYELFIERIFNKLEIAFPNASLLIVPGNHDVNRLSTKELKSHFIENIGVSDKKDFLSKNKGIFYSIFKNYSETFKDKNLPAVDSSVNENNLLYGYVLNKEKKTLIVLLNSSWYSIGDGFLKHYLDERVFKINDDEEKSSILKQLNVQFDKVRINLKDFNEYLTEFIKNKTYLINVKAIEEFIAKFVIEEKVTEGDYLSSIESLVDKIIIFIKKHIVKDIEYITNEYGKQLVGLDVFKEEYLKIQELYNTYNDFIVTTIMHHPINWLDFNERVPYKYEAKVISKFHDIKNFTDLLLTGHEHVPTEHKTEMINDNELLHIQAGCFMNFSSDPIKFKVKENWFSTLSINVNKRTVSQSKHSYESGKWVAVNLEPIKLKKKHNTILSPDREAGIKSQVINHFKLINYKHYNKVIKLDSDYYKLKKKLYKYVNDLESDNFGICFDMLKEKIASTGLNNVYFISTDCSHRLFDMYKDHKKMEVLDAIKRDFDFKFDKFRDNFFSSLCEAEAKKYKKLKFIGVVKPYWITETC